VAKITKNTIQVNSLEWFYREIVPEGGDNPHTVLLLHGLPSQSLTWTGLMRSLGASGYRSIAPDWIGFGSSSKPEPRDFKYTPAAFLTALEEFIDKLNLDRFSLVIQGFLGTVGLEYAIRHPDRIEKLIILNAPLATTVKLPWKLQQLSFPVVGEMLAQDPLTAERVLEEGGKRTLEDKFLEVYRQPYLKSSVAGRALLATVRHLNLTTAIGEITQQLPDLDRPIQIVWGTEDPWLDLASAQTMVQTLKQGNLVTLNNAAHYPQEHWYAEIKESVIPFLQRQV
jgi:pimeloyl-ACP methyl ester carboxylesterase